MGIQERAPGRWAADDLPPWGGGYPGQLQVIDRWLVFVGVVDDRRLRQPSLGPLDSRALTYALDLDTCHVTCADRRLRLSIPIDQLECVVARGRFLSQRLCLTLRDNGSVQRFDEDFLPAGQLARAIQTASPVTTSSSRS